MAFFLWEKIYCDLYFFRIFVVKNRISGKIQKITVFNIFQHKKYMRLRRARKKTWRGVFFFFVVKSGHFFGARFYAKGGAVHAKGGAACAANGVPWCRARYAPRGGSRGRGGWEGTRRAPANGVVQSALAQKGVCGQASAAAQPRPCNVPRLHRDHAIAAQPL